jgi:hypothetical protein
MKRDLLRISIRCYRKPKRSRGLNKQKLNKKLRKRSWKDLEGKNLRIY